MPLATIRSFTHAGQRYRHAMCFDTDAVFLQRYQDNDEATCDDDLWLTLLKYDRNCNVWGEGKKVGDFRTEGDLDTWVFYENPLRTRIELDYRKGAEALLNAEVEYSKHWLDRLHAHG